VKITPRRGFAVVREIRPSSGTLWQPDDNPRDVKTHRGVVLALGAPSIYGGHEVPWPIRVGDEVQYHWDHNEPGSTAPWPEDGLDASWIMHNELDGVWE
jgi:hypothetical protein